MSAKIWKIIDVIFIILFLSSWINFVKLSLVDVSLRLLLLILMVLPWTEWNVWFSLLLALCFMFIVRFILFAFFLFVKIDLFG